LAGYVFPVAGVGFHVPKHGVTIKLVVLELLRGRPLVGVPGVIFDRQLVGRDV